MAMLRIVPFNGISPRTTPRLLADTFATVARDTKLWNGSLRSWRAPVRVADLPRVGATKTIYRFGQDRATDDAYWFHWNDRVSVVRSPVAGNERTFFTGDGAPKVTDSVLALTGGGAYPNAAYDLGVPSPTQQPLPVVSGEAGEDETKTTRFYVYTFVNDWGEEGSHSPVSVGVDATVSQSITLENLEVPTGAQSYAAKRIYETAGVGESAAFYMKAEVSAGQTSATFSAAGGAAPNPEGATVIGSILKTAGWEPPPANLHGLTMMSGQILCGISGNAVRMSRPGYPYAWRARDEFKFNYDPVAIGAFGNTLVVATKGVPYLISGFEPETMQQTPVERMYACSSARSMVEIGGGVAYASPDGMIVVDQSGATNITEAFFDGDQWRALQPASMHAYWWDNQIVLFHSGGGLIFKPGAEPTELGFTTDGAFVDPQRDALYLIVGNEVHCFDAGAPQTFRWRSKVFQMGRAVNFGAAQIHHTGAVTLRCYADGLLRHERVVATREPFRLPSGFLAEEWQFELEGDGEVFSLAVGETMREMKAT